MSSIGWSKALAIPVSDELQCRRFCAETPPAAVIAWMASANVGSRDVSSEGIGTAPSGRNVDRDGCKYNMIKFRNTSSILESNDFSWGRKSENTHILLVLLAQMNFSRVVLYGLPRRKSEVV